MRYATKNLQNATQSELKINPSSFANSLGHNVEFSHWKQATSNDKWRYEMKLRRLNRVCNEEDELERRLISYEECDMETSVISSAIVRLAFLRRAI